MFLFSILFILILPLFLSLFNFGDKKRKTHRLDLQSIISLPTWLQQLGLVQPKARSEEISPSLQTGNQQPNYSSRYQLPTRVRLQGSWKQEWNFDSNSAYRQGYVSIPSAFSTSNSYCQMQIHLGFQCHIDELSSQYVCNIPVYF